MRKRKWQRQGIDWSDRAQRLAYKNDWQRKQRRGYDKPGKILGVWVRTNLLEVLNGQKEHQAAK